MSMMMLAIVALFPVTLLAILLLTSGLEGRFVSSDETRRLVSADRPQPEQAPQDRGRSGAGRD